MDCAVVPEGVNHSKRRRRRPKGRREEFRNDKKKRRRGGVAKFMAKPTRNMVKKGVRCGGKGEKIAEKYEGGRAASGSINGQN